MEIERMKALTSNKKAWDLLEEYLQGQIQQTQQELEVATSELELYRGQGKLISLRRLLSLKEQLNNNNKKSKGFFG
jgi:uncharacterized protein involved in exopolysaccharide biosynthesis